ncbi:MAG: helix-hairpin-helix domain-containing protein [Verrucomicrobiota bacterium]
MLSKFFAKKDDESQGIAAQSAPPAEPPATPPPSANPPSTEPPFKNAPLQGILRPPTKVEGARSTGKQKRITQRITIAVTPPAVAGAKSPALKIVLPGAQAQTSASIPTATGNLDLPMSIVINSIPTLLLALPADTILSGPHGNKTVSIPLTAIVGMLPTGKVEFTLKDFSAYVPAEIFKSLEQNGDEVFQLPLSEILKRVPPEMLAKRPDQKPVDEKVAQIPEPFSLDALKAVAEAPAKEATPVVETPTPPPVMEIPAIPVIEPSIPTSVAEEPIVPPAEILPTPAATIEEPLVVPPVVPPTPAQVEDFAIPAAIPTPVTETPVADSPDLASLITDIIPPAEKTEPAPVTPAFDVTALKAEIPPLDIPKEPTPVKQGAGMDDLLASVASIPDLAEVTKASAPVEEKLPEVIPATTAPAESDFSSFAKAIEEMPTPAKEIEKPLAEEKPEPAPAFETPSFELPPPVTETPAEPEKMEMPSFELPKEHVAPAESIPQEKPKSFAAPTSAPASGNVNLNQCTLEELVQQAECPEGIARKILAWRELHGPFTDLHALWSVPGMTEEVYHALIGQPDEESAVELSEIFGLPPKTHLTVKEVATRIRNWPFMTGCIIGGMEGLPIAFDCDDKKFAKAICAFAPKILQQTQSTLEEMREAEAHEIHLVKEDHTISIFRCEHLVLITINRKKGLSVRDVEMIRQIVIQLASVKEAKLEV